MRRSGIVGLGVGLVLAAGSVLVAGASAALPELGRCVAHVGGQYASGTCTALSKTPKTKLFEWEPGAVANGFAINGTSVTLFDAFGGKLLSCPASAGKGVYASAATLEITQLELTGCESGKVSCQTAAEGNSTEGRVLISPLDGALGKVSGTRAGVLLTGTKPNPFGGSSGLVYNFECGGKLTGKGPQSIGYGSVIGETIPTDRMSLTSRLRFARNLTTHRQAVKHFEGESEEHELFEQVLGPEEAGEVEVVTNPTITNEEPLEIKAK
jgi:hypothetical protein